MLEVWASSPTLTVSKLHLNLPFTLTFIDINISRQLGLYITPKTSFNVSIPGHQILHCSREIKNLRLQLGDYTLTSDFYALSIGGIDIVLGI